MIKSYKLEDLDCAACAAKMEKAVLGLPGVQNANINFLQQKITIEADDAEFDTIVKNAQKAMRKIEADVRILV